MTLISLTFFLLPFLYAIQVNPLVESLEDEWWIWNIATPISLISLLVLWVMWLVWTHTQWNKWYYFALASGLAILINITATISISSAFNEAIFSSFFHAVDRIFSISVLSLITLSFLWKAKRVVR